MDNRRSIDGQGVGRCGATSEYNRRTMRLTRKRTSRARWLAIAIIPIVLGVGAVALARGLRPQQQESLINRLPGFIQPLARSLILPAHPDIVPTPAAVANADVSSLLTPRPTRLPTIRPTIQPTDQPTIRPTNPAERGASGPPTRPPANYPTSPSEAQTTGQPTPTLSHALTPVIPPGLTQAARSTPASLQDIDILLTGFKHAYQTWNNCGPATLAMNLSYFDWNGTQADAAKFLKPDVEDKNVTPWEMAAFAQSIGLNAVVRSNGSLDLIKQFLHAGLPVLIEKGFEPEAELGWMGHYELVIGYSDARGEFIAMDSYTGPNQSVRYADFDRYWSQFNRTYIIVYDAMQSDTVMQLLGADADSVSNAAGALARAQSEAAADPSNAFAWFNIGTNFVALGEYESAAQAYDRARSLGLPWRMTWYQFGIFEAYYRTGRHTDVLALADATLKSTPYIEELWYYRGLVHQARNEIDAAREQFKQALTYNSNFKPAADALAALGG